MLKQDLTVRNPLRLIGDGSEELLQAGSFGAVLARAGVGKTALTVQIALNSLLRESNVLHISLNDPVNKVTLWYKEVFRHLAEQYNVGQVKQLWDNLLPHRLIMTFAASGFSVATLEERIEDLSAQEIFTPQMVIIDGLPFDDGTHTNLAELKSLAQKRHLHIWFTVTTHRHETPGADGLPPQLAGLDEKFDIILQLQPEGSQIHINALKHAGMEAPPKSLLLDPSTLLIKKESDN
ncbi:MAG: AAA family ATPase [Desulfosarcinaceae bacterium]|nr:AAA family ATPase [Desulfosarcinaceae bacterium]